MNRLGVCLVAILLVGVPKAFGAPITVFSASGDGPLVLHPGVTAMPVVGAGTGLESSQGFNGVGGFFGNFLRASGSVGTAFYELTLNNLPAHTSLDVNFLFAASIPGMVALPAALPRTSLMSALTERPC